MVSVWHGSVRHRALQSVKAWFRAAQNRTDDSRGECRVGVSAADGAAWISCVAGTDSASAMDEAAMRQSRWRRLVRAHCVHFYLVWVSFVTSVLSYCAAEATSRYPAGTPREAREKARSAAARSSRFDTPRCAWRLDTGRTSSTSSSLSSTSSRAARVTGKSQTAHASQRPARTGPAPQLQQLWFSLPSPQQPSCPP